MTNTPDHREGAARIQRVTAMEHTLNLASAVLQDLEQALARYQALLPALRALERYYASPLWRADFDADEAGLLPKNLPRGVLSEDAVYNLLADLESLRRCLQNPDARIAPVIHIFGASGSGTSTLGAALAEALHLRHMDTDDYYWLPADVPFTLKRPPAERLERMYADLAESGGAVISGSLCGWGDPLIPAFTHAIRVVTDTETRLRRLHAREVRRFGDRVAPGGDMAAAHQEFLDWAARYDTGDAAMRSRALHDQWQQLLPCPVAAIDGSLPAAQMLQEALHSLNLNGT